MEAESSKMGSARISHIRKRPRLEVKDDESSTQAEAQTRRPHRKGNAGKLAGLISLPLDLLFEVSQSFMLGLVRKFSTGLVRFLERFNLSTS
jgi:hypothetical protein